MPRKGCDVTWRWASQGAVPSAPALPGLLFIICAVEKVARSFDQTTEGGEDLQGDGPSTIMDEYGRSLCHATFNVGLIIQSTTTPFLLQYVQSKHIKCSLRECIPSTVLKWQPLHT
jgi:hypothetical protein